MVRPRSAASANGPVAEAGREALDGAVEVVGVAGLERQRVHHAGRVERAVERRRDLVVAERLEDREHVPQRQPLVGPVAAAEPRVDHVVVAAQRLERPARTWPGSTGSR